MVFMLWLAVGFDGYRSGSERRIYSVWWCCGRYRGLTYTVPHDVSGQNCRYEHIDILKFMATLSNMQKQVFTAVLISP
jgi:hypothetical protein